MGEKVQAPINDPLRIGEESVDREKDLLLWELYQLGIEGERLKKELELTNLRQQVALLRKRNRNLEDEIAQKKPRLSARAQEKQPESSTESASAIVTQSETGANNKTSPTVASKVYEEVSTPALLDEQVSGSSYPALTTESSRSHTLEQAYALRYFNEVKGAYCGGLQRLKDLDLARLHDLEDDEYAQTTHPPSLIWYCVFLKTRIRKDLSRAIELAEKEILNNRSPEYEPRLKDLIVMLFEKYICTKELADLESVCNRVFEMVMETPDSHPDYSDRMIDWMNLLIVKFDNTRDPEDMDALITSAQECGLHVLQEVSDEGDLKNLEISFPGSSKRLRLSFNPGKRPSVNRPSTDW